MDIRLDTLVLGPLETNCYVIRGGSRCAIVDPGMWPKPLLDFLLANQVQPDMALLTHGHADHIAGLSELKQSYPNILIHCPRGDAFMLQDAAGNMSASFGLAITAPAADVLIDAGETIEVGQTQWRILDTSGHTPGSVSYYCPDAATAITGDALFAGSIGRSDVPGANEPALLRNIRENLLILPGRTRVLPGHGPATTIEHERRTNPFLR